MRYKTTIVSFLLTISSACYGQIVASGDSILKARDIPTLQELIDLSVARAPMRGYHNERKLEAQSRIKTEKQEWTNYIGVESYYRYGRLGVIDVNSPQGTTPLPITTNSTQSQNWWYVGAYFRMPIFAVVNRGTEIKRLQHTVKQSDHEMDDVTQQITFMVIEQYNKLILNLNILEIKSSLLQTNNAQIEEAKNDYQAGKINLGRFAQLQEMQAKASVEYETARSEARIALLNLEQLTGLTLRLKHDS